MTTDAAEAVRSPVEEANERDDRHEHRRVETAITAIYADAERARRREVDEVVSVLEASGSLPDAQREAVEELANAIVGRLLAVPARSLREVATDGSDAVDAALELFEPEQVDSGPWNDGRKAPEVRDGD